MPINEVPWTLVAPLLVIQLILIVVALVDLSRRPPEAVTGGKKWPWVLVSVLISILGPIVYLTLGRKD